MSDNSSAPTSVGYPILGILGICFVVLKLTHVINWSWWYVTMPFWIGFPVVFGILLFTLFVIFLYESSKKK